MAMELLNLYHTARTAGYYALGVLVPLLHLALAWGVWRDARGRIVVLLPAWLWVATTLVLGWPGLALYWAAHHSSLRAAPGPRAEE
jgi:hypothetical protein